MNIKFEYRYRNAAYYYSNVSEVFSNEYNLSFEEIDAIIKSALIDGEWFYANKWNLQNPHQFIGDSSIDNDCQEFSCIKETNEYPTNGDIADFLKLIQSAKMYPHVSQICFVDLVNKTHGIFRSDEIVAFMHSIHCSSLKAKSSDKTDIKIVLHDLKTGLQSTRGFSIKSKLGSSSTLLNAASDNTNFIYEIHGLDQSEISSINSIDKFQQKFLALQQVNASISFLGVVSNVMQNNLVYIQDRLPELLGLIVKKYYSSPFSKISDIVEDIAKSNPLGYDYSYQQDFYQYRIKNFLVAVALGLKPGKPWMGNYDVNGGYLIVKEDGDIVCYHLYDRNEFEDYLYFNTRLETPSTTRHQFGDIYTEGNRNFIKLNLQIRFI